MGSHFSHALAPRGAAQYLWTLARRCDLMQAAEVHDACAGGSTQHALAALERLALAGPPRPEEAPEQQAESVTANGGPPPKKQHRAGKPPPGEIGAR